MSLTKTLEGPATLKPGGTVTYELKPGCSSIETPCTNAVLVDSLPEPLVLQSISYIGFEKTVTQKDPDNKTRIELAFNEKTGDVDGVGLNDGADYTVKIVAMLPADVSPELGGTKLTNSASLTSDAGSVTDEAEPVTLEIDPAPKAEITKAWAEKALLAGSGAANTVTLGGIKNASKVGATSLTILEPSGGTKPFDAVSFTGFGAVEFPAGADQIQVNYFVNGTKTDGTPGALPVIPDGMALSTITGFEFVFTSSKSTSSKGGITAGGSAGSIKLNTELRPSALVGDVNNQVSITAQTPKGDSAPKPATDKFVVDAVDYKVDAKKSFAPKKVVAENDTHIGAAQNRSTVTIGATNTSNQPLKALRIKEPAAGTAPFGDGIDFEKFVSSDWPTGAETGGITIAGTRYELERVDGKITFPADMPAGEDLKSFELSFEGTFAPNQGVELKFDVLGRKAGSHKNEIQAGGLTPGGVAATTDNAEDTLIVEDPKELFDGGKSFHHNRVEGLAGDTTSATLNTSVAPGTNVDVRKIVQTDMFDGMIADWKPTKVKITNNQGAASVLIEYMDAVGDWQTLADADGNLPADSKGVRITYTRASGTFPDANTGDNYGNVTSVVDFELKHDVATDKTEWTNVLRTADGGEFPATVTVDKKIQLGSSKSWSAGTIVQKPSNKFPASQLRLSAWNTSTYAVDSLTLADPIGAAKPFDYVTITGMHKANLSDSSSVETARLTLTMDGGATVLLTGTEAVDPASAMVPIDWANVVGIEFALVKTGEHLVPRDAWFDLTLDTELREKKRGTETLVDVALKEIGYTIPNTAEATIVRGGDSATDNPSKDLKVVTENSVVIAPVLTKSFSPAGPATFFPQNGVPTPIQVKLSLNAGGEDAADKIVFVDKDPTFWNAFDFAGWNPAPTSNGTVTIEYLAGATFTTGAANELIDDGKGTWRTTKPANDDVQGIRITMQGADYEPLDKTVNEVKFKVMPRYTLRTGELNSIDGASRNPGESMKSTVENTATAAMERLGQNRTVPDVSTEYQFAPGATKAGVSKTSDAVGGQISAGGAVNYTIEVTNSGTEAILDPVIVDKLPQDKDGLLLELDPDWTSQVKYSFGKLFNAAPQGTSMTIDSTLIGAVLANGNEATFTFPKGTKLYPGESYTIVLPVTVRAGVPAKTDLKNHADFGGKNAETVTGVSDLKIVEGQAYSSRKLVREVPSAGQTDPTGIHNTLNKDAKCFDFGGGFYRYPCVVETKPGGIAEWKLSVTNTGNVPSQHMEILDIFPFVGDTGVTASQAGKPRGSKWTPTLLDVKLPEVPEGTKMALSYLTGDPATCKPNGKDEKNPWAGCLANWVTDRPANPREIQGVKLVMDFDQGLEPKDSVALTFTTQSATEMPDGVADLAAAWNSFGYAAQAQVDGETDYRSQEPIKTGITFRPVEKAKVSVGDFVWVDGNKDGIQDGGEPGIKDVTLKLTDKDNNPVIDVYGNEVLPTMTDGNGHYTFENLPVLQDGQKYIVSIDREASESVLKPYLPTRVGAGDKDTDSSGWVAETDPSSELLKTDRDRDPSLDFGFFVNPGRVSVGDYVWVDTNRDGVQDEDEAGIPGVVLTIVGPGGLPVADVFGNPVGSATTDKDGKYTFVDLPALKDGESYTVSIDREASAEPLAPYIPTIDTGKDRESNSSTWDATSEGLTKDGDRDPSLDFGFVLPKVSVGDYVWVDTNRDGIQTDGEAGIKDVVLTIVGPGGLPVTDVFGNPVGPATTDKDGSYAFENLPVLKDGESYTVSIDKDASAGPLAPYIPTIETKDNRENDSSTWEAVSGNLLVDGAEDKTLDFGFVLPKVSLGDYVWVDTNRDGIQDSGEPGIKDVVLTILGPDNNPVTDVFGNPVGPVKTDKDGKYSFEGLPILKEGESYTVSIDKEASAKPLAPYIPTVETEGNRSKDSSTWEASSEGLTTDGDRDSSLDFGFVWPKVSVGDYVWIDSNGNGRQDKGEPGIPGVVLELTGPDGKPVVDVNGKPVGPVTTDKDGKYDFSNLPVVKDGQSYTVSINKEKSADALSPYVPTQSGKGDIEGDSSDWTAKSAGLTHDGDRDPTLDFGFVPGTVSVGDRVWVDSNKNGIQGKGEPGIPGVVLDIYGPDGTKIGSTTTDKDGNYLFKDLPVLKDGESYVVKIARKKSKKALDPYLPTIETDGNRGKDSSTWESSSTGLTGDGESDLTLDFGFVLKPETEPTLPSTDGGDNEGNSGDGTGSESGNGDGSANENGSNEKPVKKPTDDKLAATGFAALGVLGGGLLLILGGVALVRRRTRNNEA